MWERALRRAGLPLAYTEGFSPRPQLSFGLALPTGCESLAEYVDVVLDDTRPETAPRSDVGGLPALLSRAAPRGYRGATGGWWTGGPLAAAGGHVVLVDDGGPGSAGPSWSERVAPCWPPRRSPSSGSGRDARSEDDLRPSVLALAVVDRSRGGRTEGTVDGGVGGAWWPSWRPSPAGSAPSSWSGD